MLRGKRKVKVIWTWRTGSEDKEEDQFAILLIPIFSYYIMVPLLLARN